MTSGVPEAFGFVPAHVVADLQDIGNWKSRATAIDALHKCLKDVAQPSVLAPSLPDFVTFLSGLIVDPNFKIATSAMSILGDLATKVGSKLTPQLREVVSALVGKFMDNKLMVRSATFRVLRKLMHACSARAVLALLGEGAAAHSNWRVREEVVNTHIMALLTSDRTSWDPAAEFRLLSLGLSDSRDRVRMVALEGLAVLNSKLGPGELSGMMAGGGGGQKRSGGGAGPGAGGGVLTEAQRAQVSARLARTGLPNVNADGLVEHVVELPAGDNPDGRLADAAHAGAMPARSRLRNGSDGPLGLGEVARPARTAGYPTPSLDQVGRLGSDPLPGNRRNALAHVDGGRGGSGGGAGPGGQQEEGGGAGGGGGGGVRAVVSQPYAPAPSRFGSHESLGGGAPITAAPARGVNGWSSSGASSQQQQAQPQHRPQHHPPGGVGGSRTASPGREGGDPWGGPLLPADTLVSGAGGPGGALQPLKHHWGASRTNEVQSGPAGRSPTDSCEESPLSPTRGYQQLIHNHHHRHSGHTGADSSRDSLDALARPASVRTQAAAELRSHSHPPQVVPHVPPGGHLAHLGPGSAAANAQSSLGLWLQSSLEQENGVSRQETFSPSKAEMLARLKTRQIEKRAATAQQGDASFSASSASDLSLASHGPGHLDGGGGPPPGSHSFSAAQPNPRRYLFSQLSDRQRDRDRGNGYGGDPPASSRGYNSVVNTPTRAQGGARAHPFDETPASAQSHRPPRGGLAVRLGRGASLPSDGSATPGTAAHSPGSGPQSGGGHIKSPTMPAGAYNSPVPSEESPVRNPSPALNRLRTRSADPNPAAPGGGFGGCGANAVPATPIANANLATGTFWAKGGEGVGEELTPVSDPERHIKTVIARLIEANHADRKELDWQGQYEALTDARRLVRHHLDVVRSCLHDFVRAATPAIDQLRSQTSKCALTLFQECFSSLGRVMDRELDDMVPVLLKKAGEMSNAGRDNFLAAEADRTLAEMYRCCSDARSVTALLSCAGHKNPYVRVKVAFHLDNHLEACAGGGGGGGRQGLATNSACMERLFKAAAAFLDEGSLDTRTHGKRIIWHIKTMLSSRGEFDRLVAGVAPASLQRKVVDVVEGLNGPPPPPSRGVAAAAAAAGGGGGGAVGSRLASRQLGSAAAPVSPGRPLLEQMGGGGGGSLTQPPPPVRQGSFSAPVPMQSGAATPERRRLGRQRTSDLDGIPEGGAGGGAYGLVRQNSSNGRMPRVNAGAGGGGGTPARTRHAASADGTAPGYANGGGGGGGFTPAIQETVVKALQLLGAKDFRERMDALRSVEGCLGGLSGAPDSLLMPLLDALVARLGDANSKVSMVALELVSALTPTLRQRMSLVLNTLVPALAAALGSANDKIRAVAITAIDTLLGTLDPAMLVQHLSHCVANGTLNRGKPILVEKLVAVVNVLYNSKPQLVARYSVPAAFALLNDTRGGGETKAAANALLNALARLMGEALMEQAGSLNAVAQQRVADAVAAAGGGMMLPISAGGGGGMGMERERVPRGGMVGRTMA